MKLEEIFDKDKSDINSLYEEFSTDLKQIIQKVGQKPLKKKLTVVKSEIMKDFVPKLKAWALIELQHAKREGKEVEERVKKILSNTEEVADKILRTLIAREFGSPDSTIEFI